MSGFGVPEIFFLLAWVIPLWILWKFYQVLSRIAHNLASIRQTIEERPRA